jgi:release factor glutamine methyltransferase
MSDAEKAQWTIGSVLEWAAADFRSRGVDRPRLEAEVLLSHALGQSRVQLIVDSKRPLEPAELARFRDFVRRRRKLEPVAYLLGEREFYGRPFKVDARVLIPRPDTETLVDVALQAMADRSLSFRALDLCTGSGCVAITLAKEAPTATIFATDASADALAVARANLERLGAYRVALGQGDLFDVPSLRGRRFDLIVSNPPYIPTAEIPTLMADVRDHEPRLALDGGADGLDLVRRLVGAAPTYLVPGGVLALEIGAGQAPAVRAILEEVGFADVRAVQDAGRIERVVTGRWNKAPASRVVD